MLLLLAAAVRRRLPARCHLGWVGAAAATASAAAVIGADVWQLLLLPAFPCRPACVLRQLLLLLRRRRLPAVPWVLAVHVVGCGDVLGSCRVRGVVLQGRGRGELVQELHARLLQLIVVRPGLSRVWLGWGD